LGRPFPDTHRSLETAFLKADYAVHLGGEPLVMSGYKRGAPLPADKAEEFRKHSVRGLLVKVAGRLICEDQRWIVRERSRDRYALLLATRQLGGAVIEAFSEAQFREKVLGARSCCIRLSPANQLRDEHILERVEFGQQVVELINEAEQITPKAGSAFIIELRCFLSSKPD
jgi:hypothetical protein